MLPLDHDQCRQCRNVKEPAASDGVGADAAPDLPAGLGRGRAAYETLRSRGGPTRRADLNAARDYTFAGTVGSRGARTQHRRQHGCSDKSDTDVRPKKSLNHLGLCLVRTYGLVGGVIVHSVSIEIDYGAHYPSDGLAKM